MTPAPPATTTAASFSLTVEWRFSWLRTSRAKSPGSNSGVTRSTTPVRLASAAGMRMTPSRTVAICGRVFGLTIVATRFPPNAGRIWRRRSSYVRFSRLTV